MFFFTFQPGYIFLSCPVNLHQLFFFWWFVTLKKSGPKYRPQKAGCKNRVIVTQKEKRPVCFFSFLTTTFTLWTEFCQYGNIFESSKSEEFLIVLWKIDVEIWENCQQQIATCVWQSSVQVSTALVFTIQYILLNW